MTKYNLVVIVTRNPKACRLLGLQVNELSPVITQTVPALECARQELSFGHVTPSFLFNSDTISLAKPELNLRVSPHIQIDKQLKNRIFQLPYSATNYRNGHGIFRRQPLSKTHCTSQQKHLTTTSAVFTRKSSCGKSLRTYFTVSEHELLGATVPRRPQNFA